MKTIQINLYEYDELSDEAKKKAREWYVENDDCGAITTKEVMDSLKALFKKIRAPLKNWNIGAYNRGNDLTFSLGDAEDLKGARAMAWLENNLLAPLRMTEYDFNLKKNEYLKYGPLYRVGLVRPCPLTGMWCDEGLLMDIKNSVKSGMPLKDAFRSLAETAGGIIEIEIEWRHEDEEVANSIRANGYTFTENGKRMD